MLESYVIAARYDVTGQTGRISKMLILTGVVVSSAIAVINVIDYRYSFPLFSLYGFLNMIYIFHLLIRKIRSEKAFLWYLAGIIFFVTGSLIQAFEGIGFMLVFEFNKDSIYHLFVLAFLLLQFIGIEKTETGQAKQTAALYPSDRELMGFIDHKQALLKQVPFF